MKYKPFERYVLRVPIYSFSFYKNLTKELFITDEKLKTVCKDKLFKEAIFLATPSLYYEIEKWLENKIERKKDVDKIRFSILKYISRMSSRSTPFGLFAGNSVGSFSDKTKIKLSDKFHHSRHTRLDMNYLVALSQDLLKQKNIRDQVLYQPNSSLYEVGHQIRYIEYKYKNGKRNHNIVAIENSKYLRDILTSARKGVLKSDLVNQLIYKEIDKNIAEDFIEELINSQLLISEIEPSVCGLDFLEQIIKILKNKNNTDEVVKVLDQIRMLLNKLDKNFINNCEEYIKLSELIKKLGTDFELKYLFQTDLLIKPSTNFLNTEILQKIFIGLNFLNKITIVNHETNLTKFSKSFYSKYEEKEMQLSKVLDIDLGIGYLQNQRVRDNSPLIEDLNVTPNNEIKNIVDIKWTKIYSILHKEIVKSIKSQKSIIYLNEETFKDFETLWEDLPDTISSIVQIVIVDGKEKIILENFSGSSAANLLGRFCHGDMNIHNYVEEIIKKEEELNKNKILAEIIHLPEARIGNILSRPSFRKYEIPYLAKSTKSDQHQIELNDLMISIKNSREIQLRSKKHNKIILPRLSNAHNYSSNSLPIYQFLCDMQGQGLRKTIGFNLTPFQEEFEYIPRVEYCNIILSVACWVLTKERFKYVLVNINNENKLFKLMKELRNQLKLPQYILLIEGDNELLINLNNLTSLKMFLEIIKNKNKFKITEFLFTEDTIIKDSNGENYTNEVVVSFYKTNDL